MAPVYSGIDPDAIKGALVIVESLVRTGDG